MKPSWSTAPEWAKYLAMDYDGSWCWFEEEPTCHRDGVWRCSYTVRQWTIVEDHSMYESSLEARP